MGTREPQTERPPLAQAVPLPAFAPFPLLGGQRWGPREEALVPRTIIILIDIVLC